ncbi:MAG: AEC family transporter [Thauera sp.]|jgi:predicted permease|nr:AEC family transporter [Thauera sp.]
MLSTLEILIPVFALILAGFVCRRSGVFGAEAASVLNRFVVWLGLPALLLKTMIDASWEALNQPAFIGAFSLSCALIFVLVLIVRLASGKPLADASIDAIAGAYPNTGYIGFPLCLIAFGPESLAPTSIATILVACVMFALAIVLIEVGLHAQRSWWRLAGKVLLSLARNPLVVAPLLGVLLSVSALELPRSATTFLELLSNAASPCALVGLGLFLAERRSAGSTSNDSATTILALVFTKLLLQPALTWWLCAHVFGLPLNLAAIATVLSALPTGTGPFMLAEYYRREAVVSSRTILLTTLVSLLTLTLLLRALLPTEAAG